MAATKAGKSGSAAKGGATKSGAAKGGATKGMGSKAGASKAGATKSGALKASPTIGRTPKMTAETRAQLQGAKKEVTVAVKAGAKFDSIVKELNRRLVIDPGIIGPRGCAPCRSGLDRIIIQEEIVQKIR